MSTYCGGGHAQTSIDIIESEWVEHIFKLAGGAKALSAQQLLPLAHHHCPKAVSSKRRRLRSRNRVVDQWLATDGVGSDVFADLDDFIV